MPVPPVHLITDARPGFDLAGAARSALAGIPPGAVALHLRAKLAGGRELLALARALREVTRAARQLLVVNDRVDVAVLAGADGVHLPSAGIPPAEARRLLPDGLVGVSCHAADDVRRAREGGADYATFGPVFDTPSKRAYGAPVGLDALAAAARLGLPLVALGGIEIGTAAAARAAGAHGVAAIRAWLDAADRAAAVRALLAACEPRHRDAHGNPRDLEGYVARMLDPSRDAWQRPDEVVRRLGLRDGATVCELGAGPGYFTTRLARAVGPGGRVLAVDVAPELLRVLRERLAAAGAANVTVIEGSADDPRLPADARLDAALVVNTFHHFPDGAAALAGLARRLAPGGRIVNVDFLPGELPVGPGPEHKVPKEAFLAAARAAGLEVVADEDFLPYQYVVVLAPAQR